MVQGAVSVGMRDGISLGTPDGTNVPFIVGATDLEGDFVSDGMLLGMADGSLLGKLEGTLLLVPFATDMDVDCCGGACVGSAVSVGDKVLGALVTHV